jgi:hypothetical protein
LTSTVPASAWLLAQFGFACLT